MSSSRPPGPLGLSIPPSGGLHPDAPAARFDVGDARNVPTGPGGELARVDERVEALFATYASRLRQALPDPFLQTVYDLRIGDAAATYRRERAGGAGGSMRESLLRRLHASTSWVDGTPGGRVPEYWFRGASGPSLGGADDPPEPKELLQQFEAVANHVFESARTRLELRWAEASVAGSRAPDALLAEWKRRLEIHRYTRPTGVGEEHARQVSPPVTQKSILKPAKTWVEIQLIDEDGNPVPNVEYDVTLPGGERRTGRLGADATLSIEDIDPGQCQVRFPELDGREWRSA